MQNVLIYIEFIVAIFLVLVVMLQNRGTGLGGVFASEANIYRSKRGIEKLLFNSTIFSAVVLVATILVHLILRLKLSL